MALGKDKYRLTHLSMELLQAYHKGNCTHEEMHAIEKHMLDCEFCADAFEGFEALENDALCDDLAVLETRLGQRIKKKSDFRALWVAAASVTVILLSVWILFPEQNEPLALKEEKAAKESSEEITTTIQALDSTKEQFVENTNEMHTDESASKQLQATKPKRVARVPKFESEEDASVEGKLLESIDVLSEQDVEEPIPDETNYLDQVALNGLEEVQELAVVENMDTDDQEETVLEEVVVVGYQTQQKREITGAVTEIEANTIKPDEISKTSTVERRLTRKKRKERFVADQDFDDIAQAGNTRMNATGAVSRATSQRSFVGRVIDIEDGAGIPGVVVYPQFDPEHGAITDLDGYFTLSLDTTEAILICSFVGYETKEVAARSDELVDVAMTLDVESLSEVVVVGYGQSSDYSAPPSITRPRPKMGNSKFRKHILQQLIYPDQALANKVEGRVKLQFHIDAQGVISNVTVVRGIGYGCDQEAIRLIMESGEWESGKIDGLNSDMDVNYTIRFKLPKTD